MPDARAGFPGGVDDAPRRAPRPSPPNRAASSTSAAPGFDVRTRTKTPASRGRATVSSGFERVAAHVGADRHRVGAEAVDVAERRRRGAEQRLRVGEGARRRCRRAWRRRGRAARRVGVVDDEPSASRPGAPRRSKQASCGLTATTASPTASITAAQCAATAAAPLRRRSRGRDGCRVRPQPGRVRIEAEDDLAERAATAAASRSPNGAAPIRTGPPS